MTQQWKYDTAGFREDQRGYDRQTRQDWMTPEEYTDATTKATAEWHAANPPRTGMTSRDIKNARQRLLEEIGLLPADGNGDHQAGSAGSSTMPTVASVEISGEPPDPSAVVYVMTMPGSRYVKVGITARGEARLSEHTRNGFERYAEVEVATVDEARRIEQAILRMANQGDAMVNDSEALRAAMPQGGFTEVFTLPPETVAMAIRNMATSPTQEPAP